MVDISTVSVFKPQSFFIMNVQVLPITSQHQCFSAEFPRIAINTLLDFGDYVGFIGFDER